MHIYQTPLKCSECGSTNSESFFRSLTSGIRCLSCGHEKIKSIMTHTENTQDTYYKMQKQDDTF